MLIKHIFGDIAPVEEKTTLRDCLEKSFNLLNLSKNEIQIQKCLELNDQLGKRMGVMVFGPPDSGKTSIISLLKSALISNGRKINVSLISPKAVHRSILLGKINPDTRTWIDGLLITRVLSANLEPTGKV